MVEKKFEHLRALTGRFVTVGISGEKFVVLNNFHTNLETAEDDLKNIVFNVEGGSESLAEKEGLSRIFIIDDTGKVQGEATLTRKSAFDNLEEKITGKSGK
ncbi:MAG: hypothetical protein ABFQ53_02140 [Patescibacteria group bacterium]